MAGDVPNKGLEWINLGLDAVLARAAFWFAELEHFGVSLNRGNALAPCFIALSSRGPVSASLENALASAAWNAGIVGLLVACCSALAFSRNGDWIEWSNLTLGCWTIVASRKAQPHANGSA